MCGFVCVRDRRLNRSLAVPWAMGGRWPGRWLQLERLHQLQRRLTHTSPVQLRPLVDHVPLGPTPHPGDKKFNWRPVLSVFQFKPSNRHSIRNRSFLSTKHGQHQHDPVARTCPQGQRLVMDVPYGHWKTTTFVVDLRTSGLGGPDSVDGPITGDVFVAMSSNNRSRRCERPFRINLAWFLRPATCRVTHAMC
jgi:hypothetical protein